MKCIKQVTLIILLLTCNLIATNYYIDATNGNDNNFGKSPATAWKSCSKVNSSLLVFQPGDSILFKRGEIWAPTSVSGDGILSIKTQIAGTSTAYIIFGAFGSGSLPVISTIGVGDKRSIDMAGAISYIIFQDLKLIGGIWIDGNHGDIHNIKFLHLTMDGTGTDSYSDWMKTQICAMSTMTEISPDVHSGERIDNFEIAYCTFNHIWELVFNCDFNNSWIHHNKITNIVGTSNRGEGLDFAGGDNIKIEYNDIMLNNSNGYGIKMQSQVGSHNNIIIRYNLIRNTQTGGAIAAFNIKNSFIYNNTFVPNFYPNGNVQAAVFGFNIGDIPVNYGAAQIPQVGFSNNLIANNIFIGRVIFQNPKGVTITYKDGTIINYSLPSFNQINQFKNNLIWDPSCIAKYAINVVAQEFSYIPPSYMTYSESTAGKYIYSSTTSSNQFYDDTQGGSIPSFTLWTYGNNVSGNIFGDPKFVNVDYSGTGNYYDLTLQPNVSPCLGAGISIPGASIDLNGHPVPAGNPDLGCYQTYTEHKTLDLLTPDNLENLIVGTSYNITWTCSQINNIKLEYTTNNGTSWNTIINSISASTGSYTWTVPANPSSLCKVRISDASDPTVNDISNNIFTIYQPALSLTSPNGGENWFSGQTYSITWTSNSVDNIKLEYTTNNGTSWVTINASTSASSGNFTWTLPAVSSSFCKVKISNTNNPSLNSINNNTFSILQPVISLISPNGGEIWLTGEVHNINWNSTDITALRIDYSTNNGASWNNISPNTTASAGSYPWTIPNIQSANCKVKIADVNNSTNNDQSDNTFTISNPYIDVNIRVFLQSPFNNGLMNTTLRDNGLIPLNQPYNTSPWNYTGNEIVPSMPNGIVDWILLELRRDTSASSIIARRAAFLTSSGNVVDIDGTSNVRFYNINEGNYYVAVKHRNHLGIMTSTLINLSKTSSLYDFTTSLNKAFGNNSMNMLSDGVYGMCSGDANDDGAVNIFDYGEVGKSIFNTGYLREDIDMNGIVNVLDYQKIYINIFKFSLVRN